MEKRVLLILLLFFCASLANHYQTLGISRDATPQDIKRAYKKLALQWHPDKNAGDENAAKKYSEISNAYEVLSDDNKKRQYDITGEDNPGQGRGGFGHNFHHQGGFPGGFPGGGRTFSFQFGGGGSGRHNRGHWGNSRTQFNIPSETETLQWLNFDTLTSEGVWLVQFFSRSSQACERKSSEWESLYRTLKGSIRMGRVDAESEVFLPSRYHVSSVPTIIAFVDGEPFYYNGEFDKKELLKFTRSLITSNVHIISNTNDWKTFYDARGGKPVVLLYKPAGMTSETAQTAVEFASHTYRHTMKFAMTDDEPLAISLGAENTQNKATAFVVRSIDTQKITVFDIPILKETLFRYQFDVFMKVDSHNYNLFCSKKCILLLGGDDATHHMMHDIAAEHKKRGGAMIGYVDCGDQEEFCRWFEFEGTHPVLVFLSTQNWQENALTIRAATKTQHIQNFILSCERGQTKRMRGHPPEMTSETDYVELLRGGFKQLRTNVKWLWSLLSMSGLTDWRVLFFLLLLNVFYSCGSCVAAAGS
ncbi:DnaJ domain containing protein [Planoprotostelium fungivorum]|uniref:DnaJ homolog subfamily C member 16 n=1 Tax=Planoprotostelium fungivorum TaxID=1890364 RepID=A0A2P6MN87_9EUKA|nr:DnaJ domain containing protein [Planoprotostelium fungivorum]